MSPVTARRIGRFDLLSRLGQGAQATVWRAHDPTLQRDVALKLIHPAADAETCASWLNEARLAGALQHPGIVPVFDVGQEGAQSYIVSECVAGPTLAEHLRLNGALPARDAVQLMREVLDALAAAHARGVVHRDLKPSNVLLGEDGRPRVMDFGIAARLSAEHDGRIVGTPGYISPEAAAGQAPSPAMDVFAAGMMLGQMLTGRAWRDGRDPMQALQRAIQDEVRWPDGEGPEVDDALRSIVLRAAARAPDKRWPGAAAFRDALDGWLSPGADAAAGHGTLNFLLRRMRLNGDFPALSDAVLRIQRITSSDTESLHVLSAEILRDVALTQRLLRLVNSAQFRRVGAGEISTVSRAAALVGFGGIRNMALSLLLIEHMGDRAHADRMKGLFLEALLTSTLVDQLTPASREREEAFVAGMLSHLGRLLCEYYFPQEAARVRSHADPHAERAQIEVLGLSYDALGQGVAAVWDLPDSLRRLMAPPQGEVPQRHLDAPEEQMRWRVRAAGELVQALMAGDEHRHRVAELSERYARPLGLSAQALSDAVQVARGHLVELAAGLGLAPAPTARARRLLAAEPTVAVPAPPAASAAQPQGGAQSQALLSAGIADVTASLAGDSFKLNEVLRIILETMWRALDFQRVVFCLRDPRSGALTGRLGLGDGVEALRARFRVEAGASVPADLFAAACKKGVDTLIADACAASLAPRLPAWYREAPARGFLLLPMMMKSAPFALIYADSERADLQPSEQELTLLRTLRNQAVMAFKASA